MLIEIVILLLLFILIVYLSKNKEGLMNQYEPIRIRRNDPDYIYRKMITPGNPLYDARFSRMTEGDVVNDMAYFNNASMIIYMMTRYGGIQPALQV